MLEVGGKQEFYFKLVQFVKPFRYPSGQVEEVVG